MADFIDLIGAPFKYGARGPDLFDCYGLVMECARRDGVTLPEIGSATEQAMNAAIIGASLPMWRATSQKYGAVAVIRVGRHVAHVGYVCGPDHMIHAWEDSGGVTIVRLADWQHRIIGFYEYAG